MTREEYKAAIEAILFASGTSVPASRLAQTLEITEKQANDFALELCKEYEESDRGINVIRLDKSYQMVSKKAYAPQIRTAMDLRRNVPLSQAAMEVLAVVAYNQPVTKSFIEQVRGVDCSGVIGSLTTKDLIEEKGRLELPGRPLLYGTTENFLRCFSISSIDELPPLPQKQQNPDENALEDDSQLSIFEGENAQDVSAESDKVADDDTITATVGDIIEQATAD
ncbi:MAG: SMC-Scp complex subunit ScpB [Ruminococcaceae bacterium]|nr:SMC-Scp complex subunit ScpB [Oscillospiraceae bacterium]